MKPITHSVATVQCKTSNQPLLPGNIVPHSWYKKFRDNSGNPDLIAISLLADIVAWNRSGANNYFGENVPSFDGKELCLSYNYFEEKFCLSKDRVRRALVRLESLNILQREIRNIKLSNGNNVNKVFITLDQNFFKSCFRSSELDIRTGESKILNSQIKVNLSTDIKNSLVFIDPSLDGCNDHISNKNYNKRNRSIETPSLNTTILQENNNNKSSFLKKNLFLEKENNFNKKINQTIPTNQSKQSNQQFKFLKPKVLKDFYPLTAEDCSFLQAKSGRDFNLRSMNEILLDMSNRLKDRVFNSKKGFLSYMSKVFAYEMRDAVKISNETFRIRSNQTDEGIAIKQQENFLTEIENSLEVSPQWHLKKKLVCVLDRAKAYTLLTAYKDISQEGSIFKIHLSKHILLEEYEKAIILKQVQATHDNFYENKFFEKLEIQMPEKSGFEERKSRAPNKKEQIISEPLPDTIWSRLRKALITSYGEGVDKNWLSKLNAEIDETNRAIHLKAPSEFIKDWVQTKYFETIENFGMGEEYRVMLS